MVFQLIIKVMNYAWVIVLILGLLLWGFFIGWMWVSIFGKSAEENGGESPDIWYENAIWWTGLVNGLIACIVVTYMYFTTTSLLDISGMSRKLMGEADKWKEKGLQTMKQVSQQGKQAMQQLSQQGQQLGRQLSQQGQQLGRQFSQQGQQLGRQFSQQGQQAIQQMGQQGQQMGRQMGQQGQQMGRQRRD
jgi:hypothetical protein